MEIYGRQWIQTLQQTAEPLSGYGFQFRRGKKGLCLTVYKEVEKGPLFRGKNTFIIKINQLPAFSLETFRVLFLWMKFRHHFGLVIFIM